MSALPTEPDYTLAESFLESLGGPAWREEVFTFQSFDDDADRERERRESAKASKKKPGSHLTQVRSGRWEDQKMWLTTMNLNGAGVYVTINKTDGRGRKVENIQERRAIWCEWDEPGALPRWPIEPHMLVETSPRHFHVYWLCEPLQRAEFSDLMDVMVRHYGSDPDAKDASRVLRIPGFHHRKVNAKKGLTGASHLVNLVENNDLSGRYEPETLFEAFKVAKYREERDAEEKNRETKRKRGRPTKAPLDEPQVREALKFIPSDPRDTWRTVGMALASSRDKRAFALWDEWSQSSPKYDAEDQHYTWNTFREIKDGEYEGGVTLGTLFKIAKEGGYRRRSKNWEVRILRNVTDGRPINCVANVELVLNAHAEWAGKVRLNCVTGETLVNGEAWRDANSVFLAGWFRDKYRMAASTLYCHEAIAAGATKNSFNPIVEYLEALPRWDGVKRIADFFPDYFGSARDDYTAWVATYFFRALIERAYSLNPGGRVVMVRLVPVLEGPQDRGKTRALRALGGQWYKEITGAGESKDFLIKLAGCWVGEMAELDTMNRTGLARLKAVISAVEDKFRPLYERAEITQRRLAVFVGTTNTADYRKDNTGNTRFLPIRCPEVNVTALANARDQLFAEALAARAQNLGKEWWQAPADIWKFAQDEQEARHIPDPWEGTILKWLNSGGRKRVSIEEVLDLCLEIPKDKVDQKHAGRVVKVFQRGGWTRRQRRDGEDGKRRWAYESGTYVPPANI